MPESFNLETAKQDFAGPGRKIECPAPGPGEREGRHARRQMLLTVNGWKFSAIWGFGAYCSGARNGIDYVDEPPIESPDAEIAVWKGDGPMIQLRDDTVEGWISPASFLAAVEAAEDDDIAAIRAALVRNGD